MPSDLPGELIPQAELRAPSLSFEHTSLKQALAGVEREFIAQVLTLNEGRKVAAAKALGISRKTLWEKMQRYQLDTIVTEK